MDEEENEGGEGTGCIEMPVESHATALVILPNNVVSSKNKLCLLPQIDIIYDLSLASIK